MVWWRRKLLIIVLCAFAPLPGAADDTASGSLIAATSRYEFHSNFWLNLHHYLYALAQRPPERPLESTRGLSPDEIRVLVDAIAWYRDNLGKKDLLLNQEMYAIKRSLILFGPDQSPQHEAISEEQRRWLEAAQPIYAKHFWGRHDLQNRETVGWQLARLLKHEQAILDRIAALAQQPWPPGRIRVDLTWHANWAGAYCTTNPIHAVMTSRNGGPENSWPPTGWFELVFHEPSHALISDDDSAVARAIATAAAELGIEPPGQLWHALLFYFSGSAVLEALATEGVDAKLLMQSEGIFSRYHQAVFTHMPAYLDGSSTLRETVLDVLKALE